jgi:hypothetical protein
LECVALIYPSDTRVPLTSEIAVKDNSGPRAYRIKLPRKTKGSEDLLKEPMIK